MKAKKWLLIIVAILLLINGAYYFIFNIIGFNNFVKDRIEVSLASRTKSQVKIEKLDFNDNRLTIFGLSSYRDDYSLDVESITVDYNLLFLPFFKFLPRKAISKVLVYKPKLTVKSRIKAGGSKLSGRDLGVLLSFLPDFSVIEGFLDLDITSKGKFVFQDKIDLFSCSYSLGADERISSSFYVSSGSRKLESNLVFGNGVLDTFRLQADSFALPGLALDAMDSLQFFLDGYVYGSHQTLAADLKAKNIFLKSGNLGARLPNLSVTGDEKLLQILVAKGEVLGTPLEIQSTLVDALHSDMEFYGKLSLGAGFVIDDIYAKRKRENNESKWAIERAFWLKNKFQGEFVTDYKSFDFSLYDSSFVVKNKDFLLQSSLQILASWKGVSGFRADFDGDSLLVMSENFIVQDAQLQGHLAGSDFTASLSRKDSLAQFDFRGNLFTDSCAVDFQSQEFDPNLLLRQKNRYLPMCRVSSSGFILGKVLHSKIDIFLQDSYYGLVSGSFGSQVVYDFEQGNLDMSLRSYKSTFNYNLFDLDLHAEGSFDSLTVDNLVINEKLRGKFLFTKDEEYKCSGFLLADALPLQVWQKYFTKKVFSQPLDGTLSTSLELESDGKLRFNLQGRDLSYGNWQGVDADLHLSGDLDSLLVDNLEIRAGNDTIGTGSGSLFLDTTLRMKGTLDIKNLNLAKIQAKEHQEWTGDLRGHFLLDYQKDSPLFSGDLECESVGYKSFRFSSGSLQFRQEKEKFVVERCELGANKSDEQMRIKGALSYNFLSGYVYPSDAKLQVYYQGDFLRGLAGFVPYIKNPSSKSRLALNLWMSDKGLRVKEGAFVLKEGKLKLKNQPAEIKDVDIDLKISHDSLHLDKFQISTADGKLHLRNEFTQSQGDLVLGNLNLGKIYFWSSSGKISFNFPDYMDDNAVAKVEVMGMGGSGQAFVQGPAEEMLISCQLSISDAQAMFPKKSKNLLKLITETYSLTQGRIHRKLPLFVDLMLSFQDNVYYKTYPVNLLVDKGSFLRLYYEKDERWELRNGELSSASGDMDLFSSVFTADNVNLRLSKTNSLLDIYAKFEATAVDGNTVTLTVKTIDRDRFSAKDNLDMELVSTDRDLTSRLEIISSLKYDISQENNDPNSNVQSLMNAQVIDLVGGGVQSQILDPLLSPVENRLQRALRLDMFRIKMNVVQNLLEDYDNQQTISDEQGSMGSSEILLNNMQILLGKSLTSRLFFVSEFNIEETDDPLLDDRELLLNQKVGFRYILPYNFRFQYDYNFSEDSDNNLYELNLKKSIDF